MRTTDTGVCNGKTFNVMAGASFDDAMLHHAEDDNDRLGTLALFARALAKHTSRSRSMSRSPSQSPDLRRSRHVRLVGNIGTLKGGAAALPDSSPKNCWTSE